MKKKYLKKMLAIILAAMTVSTTPILVGAIKEASQKTINEVNSKIANDELNESEAADWLNKLDSILDDDETKAEVAKAVYKIASKGLLKTNSIDRILKMLEKCVGNEDAKDNIAYPSQHIGNTNKPKTLEFLRDGIENMQRILKINDFDVIACDMHPHFFTTRLAYELGEKYDAEVMPIQHHHAHSAALANDYGIDEMIVIAADGVGYGSDKTSWGGEILYTDINDFERLAHLQPQLMPGGDIATKYPARMLASILNDMDLISNYSSYFKYGEIEIKNIFKQIDAKINVGKTTSTGRVLDSMAVALEICHERSYEGECSMKLESAAYYSTKDLEIPVIIENNQLNTTEILREVVKLYQNGEKASDVASAGQNAVASGLSQLAIDVADKKKIDVIGATGGVFYNEAITKTVKNNIETNGYKFIQHKNTCAGDGSVSLGQCVIVKKK